MRQTLLAGRKGTFRRDKIALVRCLDVIASHLTLRVSFHVNDCFLSSWWLFTCSKTGESVTSSNASMICILTSTSEFRYLLGDAYFMESDFSSLVMRLWLSVAMVVIAGFCSNLWYLWI